MIPFHQVRRRMFNTPLLVTQPAAEAVSTYVLERIMEGRGGKSGEDDAGTSRQFFNPTAKPDGSSVEGHAPRASRFYGDYPVDADANGRPKPYRRTPDGTAIITVVGELVNRGAWVGASSGLVSYEGLKFQANTARSDRATRNVVVDMETPGGEAIGAQECAAVFRELAKEKPVIGVVNGMACSAGYALLSGASRIVTMPSALSAHIGVVMLHLDWSAWLKDNGIKPTFIFVGDHKVDGNPYEALPEAVRARFKAECEKYYADFVATVVAGRKGLTEDQVRATQALAYKGTDAVTLGLADELGTFEDVLAELSRPSTANPSFRRGATSMENPNNAAPQSSPATGIPQADHDRAVKTAGDTARAEGETAGEKKGADAAQKRIAAIIDSPAAQGREPQARHFAFKTTMSVEDAIAALEAAPPAAAGKAPGLTEQMRSEAKTDLGAPQPAGAQPDTRSAYEKGREIAQRALGKKVE